MPGFPDILALENQIDLLENYRFTVRTLNMEPALCTSRGIILTLIFPSSTVSLSDSYKFSYQIGSISFE